MVGHLTLDEFGYAFAEAMVQTSPDTPPIASKMMRLVTSNGIEIHVPFVGAEQWKEFQRQVAEQEAPSDIVIAPGGVLGGLPRINGKLN